MQMFYKEVQIKSTVPVYAVGAVWVLYALLFPMYRFSDYLIAAAVSAVVYFVSSRIFKPKTVVVEEAVRTGDDILDDMLVNIKGMVQKLESVSRGLKGTEMKKAAAGILETTDSIVQFVVKNKEKAGQIRQFQSYFMPTALELFERYAEFEGLKERGQNINNAMKEIEAAVPDIQVTFRKVFDDLYADKAIDISVETEVLKQMISRDKGLMG